MLLSFRSIGVNSKRRNLCTLQIKRILITVNFFSKRAWCKEDKEFKSWPPVKFRKRAFREQNSFLISVKWKINLWKSFKWLSRIYPLCRYGHQINKEDIVFVCARLCVCGCLFPFFRIIFGHLRKKKKKRGLLQREYFLFSGWKTSLDKGSKYHCQNCLPCLCNGTP